MAKVLVVGGAGYVGSATCALLLERGHQVWILDDLSTGHSELILSQHFIRGKVGDPQLVRALLREHSFDCVFHFAAKNIVSESVLKRDEYFENNVDQTEVLLNEMVHATTEQASFVPRFIFSSTCAIFGDVGDQTLHERLPKNPLNPYGETKLKVEHLLESHFQSRGVQSAVLRYFNASGAEPQGRVGEWHVPETHLIPRVFQEAIAGNPISVFGDQYPTPDGTCVRDYIHVTDLAEAHLAAMNKLLKLNSKQGIFLDYNLGSEKGYSVKEVIAEAAKVVGKSIELKIEPPRAGDAVKLVADSTKAKTELGFQPKFSLHEILKSAWAWEQKRLEFKPQRAVFLDRDETMNPDPGYINHPDDLDLFPWVAPQVAKLKSAGYRVFVVSNQSGIGRGFITWEQIHEINFKLNRLLFEQAQVQLDEIANCPHHPDENCSCRKPKPGLLFELKERFNLDLSQSFMIGDRESDYQVGVNAGCKQSFKVGVGDEKGFIQAIESILKT